MAQSIEYWFTCGSTYNYLTVNRIEALADQAGVSLVLKPFYLGKFFRETGNWPFNDGTPKTRYMWHDIGRSAALLGLSPKLPAPYPCPETDLANRIAHVTIANGHGLAWVKQSYKAWYEDGLTVGSEANLAQSLLEVGLPVRETLTAAEEAGSALEAATEEARDKGVFGSPSFIADGELYWGNDRLEQALGL